MITLQSERQMKEEKPKNVSNKYEGMSKNIEKISPIIIPDYKLRGVVQLEEQVGDTICHECGSKNPAWYAENDLFNKVNGSPNGILCPLCFQDKADKKGFNIIFKAVYTNPVKIPI